MEHAIHISALEDLRHFFGGRFARVYFGSEFCPWLLPDLDRVKQALDFCHGHGVAFTLVTPILTEPHLDAANALLDRLPSGTEVVLNDWGLLRSAVARGMVPIAGRALIKVKRDPRINKSHLADLELARYLRGSNLAQPAFQRFLIEQGIARAELDNVPQGYALSLPSDLHTSLYYPYVYASATRRCALLGSQDDALTMGACREHCGRQLVRASIPRLPGNVGSPGHYYILGPMLYFENTEQPRNTAGWNLNRLVFQPRPPVKTSDPKLSPFGDWNATYERMGKAVQWGHDDPDSELVHLVRETLESPTSRFADVPNPRVLDLGCGNGRNSLALRSLGLHVIALDFAPAALRQHRARSSDAILLAANAKALPLAQACIDGVVDSGCFHAMRPEDRPRYVREIRDALAPGGWIVVVARQRPSGLPPTAPVFFAESVLPEWGVTPDDLRELFGPPFSLQQLRARQGRGDESFYYALYRDQRGQ